MSNLPFRLPFAPWLHLVLEQQIRFWSCAACNTPLCKQSAGKPEDSQTQVEYMMSLDKERMIWNQRLELTILYSTPEMN